MPFKVVGALFIGLCLLVPLAQVAADPGEVDAPDSCTLAQEAAPGVLLGDLSGDDQADWFAYPVPQTHYLHIVLTVTEPPANLPGRIVLTNGNCEEIAPIELTWGGIITLESAPPSDGTLRVGVLPSPWGNVGYEYRLEVLLVPRPAFAISNLTITPAPAADLPASLYTGTQWWVSFDLRNEGVGAGSTTTTLTITTPTDGTATTVFSEPVALTPGDARSYHILWDAALSGTVGEALVTASAPAYFNMLPEHTVTVRSYALVPGTGLGATLGAGHQQVCPLWWPAASCTDWFVRPGYTRIAHGDAILGIPLDYFVVTTALGPSPTVGACAGVYYVGVCQQIPPRLDDLPHQVCVSQWPVGWSCTDWTVQPNHARVAHGDSLLIGQVDSVVVWAETEPSPSAGACLSVLYVGTCQSLP